MRLPAHDELAPRPAPARDARLDELRRQRVEFDLRGLLRRLDLAARLGERAPADARVEVIGRLDERRGRQVPWNRQHAVLDAAVLGDENGEHALSFEPHEVDLLQAHVGLVDRDDAGRAGETREQPRRLGEHALEVALLGGGLDLRLDARALLRPDVADLQAASRRRNAGRARSGVARR